VLASVLASAATEAIGADEGDRLLIETHLNGTEICLPRHLALDAIYAPTCIKGQNKYKVDRESHISFCITLNYPEVVYLLKLALHF
jgi:hypothetical protein